MLPLCACSCCRGASGSCSATCLSLQQLRICAHTQNRLCKLQHVRGTNLSSVGDCCPCNSQTLNAKGVERLWLPTAGVSLYLSTKELCCLVTCVRYQYMRMFILSTATLDSICAIFREDKHSGHLAQQLRRLGYRVHAQCLIGRTDV